jgi:hypothetical protein
VTTQRKQVEIVFDEFPKNSMNVYLGVYNENQEGKAISNCKLK